MSPRTQPESTVPPTEPAPFRPWLTIVAGILIIALLAPLSQYLTTLTINNSAETATPVAWAVGLVFSFALVSLTFRQITRVRLFSPANLALLYCMLAIAVPLMNIGLVRLFFLNNVAVLREYLLEGNSTYRTAYSALNSEWFPLVPTEEGLAWNKADRLLRLLEDPELKQEAFEAHRKLTLLLSSDKKISQLKAKLQSQQLEQATEGGNETTLAEEIHRAISCLSLQHATEIQRLAGETLLRELDLWEELEQRQIVAKAASMEAVNILSPILKQTDEWAVSIVPEIFETLDLSSRNRIEEAINQATPERREQLEKQRRPIESNLDVAQQQIALLGQADYARLRSILNASYLQLFATIPEEQYEKERNSFVYRLTRSERRQLIQQEGQDNLNQNLWAFRYSLWSTPAELQLKEQQATWNTLFEAASRLPWNLWLKPILLWGSLFIILFLFIMCLAEWFRRKWVDQENLPFPLVDIVDSVIRHDRNLENAADPRFPAQRPKVFNNWFLVGMAAGFLILTMEALNHYGILTQNFKLYFEVSRNIFEPIGGAMQHIPPVIFVASPIIIGIAFLLSLETSFSIWATFVIYTLIVWWIKLGLPEIKDSNYTGFDGGKLYPFHMEQMLGAAICFALFLVIKQIHSQKERRKAQDNPDSNEVQLTNLSRESESVPNANRTQHAVNTSLPETGESIQAADSNAVKGSYVPPHLTRAGLICLPLIAGLLLWSTGIHSLALLLIAGIAILAQMITLARLRSETGMPDQHVFYEFTKLPMVFGMTGHTGAKVFSAFLNIAFLPMSLLFRTLPQQLENLELARRHQIPYRSISIATLVAFLTAIGVGMFSFIILAYHSGAELYTTSGVALPPMTTPASAAVLTYPLWVSHFLGEPGLDNFDQVNMIRVLSMGIGFLVVAALLLMRKRFMRFPIHPVGYLVILFSIYYNWVTPYVRPDFQSSRETTLLWGSVFTAWLIKKLIIKYGGMNSFKSAKPFFIGLTVGAVLCVFFWNGLDLCCSALAEMQDDPSAFLKHFTEVSNYVPLVY